MSKARSFISVIDRAVVLALADGPKTNDQIAEATGRPVNSVRESTYRTRVYGLTDCERTRNLETHSGAPKLHRLTGIGWDAANLFRDIRPWTRPPANTRKVKP